MTHGVVNVALTAIATHLPNVEGNLADEVTNVWKIDFIVLIKLTRPTVSFSLKSIELLMEMMNEGNPNVQKSIVEYIDVQDFDAKFLGHMRSRFLASMECIAERKNQTFSGFVDMNEEQRDLFVNASQSFLCLKQLCEG
jgi:rRNA maturation protein Rpf1